MDENKVSNFIHDIIDEYVESENAKRVHTRFPPEPNGYLHIGHCKALAINFGTAKKYNGICNLRMDDTNPAKEDTEFVDAIKEDIHWLGFDWEDRFYYGSDYFEKTYEFAEELIRQGDAYVCELTPEEFGDYRGDLTNPAVSPYRDRPAEESLDLFRRMRAGEFPEGKYTLRAKIDLASGNFNMRDPVFYRIRYIEHHRQGTKWCIFPMYDYAHPVQDMLEGITHSLCSLEYENHRPLYNWVVERVNKYCGLDSYPRQIEFARLNLTHTVMSKRFLRKLVESGIVDGWDDPRMPTMCGLRRRGYTPVAILDFLGRIGVAKNDSIVDIKLLEHCLREDLNKIAPRRIAVTKPIKVIIENYEADKMEYFLVPNNPEDPEAGKRKIPFSRELWIEEEDFAEAPPPRFQRMTPGREVRLMGSYIVKCERVEKNEDGSIKHIVCTADLVSRDNLPFDGRKVRGTIHWVSAKHAIEASVNLYDNLFTLENVNDIPEDKTYDDYINPESVIKLEGCKLEPSLAEAKEGERYQFVRLGYFCLDNKSENTFNRIVSLKDSYKPGK
ncbi:MAG: glutamine--tRNA ligase/YqeY domain fusion protein [Clostridiales bacterium]|nr:glutamine--tRNA ligase/YqeY domain fusion protein [Clostridiales bacterium]